jgi:hypothetical protein
MSAGKVTERDPAPTTSVTSLKDHISIGHRSSVAECGSDVTHYFHGGIHLGTSLRTTLAHRTPSPRRHIDVIDPEGKLETFPHLG